MRSLSTLLLVAVVASVTGPEAAFPGALALSNQVPPPARRFEHSDNVKRMLRKRGPAPPPRAVKRQDDPADPPVDPPVSPSVTPSNTPTPTTGRSSTPVTPTTTSTTSTSSTPTPTTRTSTEREESVTSPRSPTATARTASRSSTSRVSIQTPSASAPPKAQDPDASFLPKPVMIGLIVAAASCVCAAALWTIIRKWKFGASRQFEDRLEPVEWEQNKAPNSGLTDHDPSAVAVHRGNSLSSQGHDTGYAGYGAYGARGNTMASTNNYPASMAPDLPPHDFTSGNGALGPNSYEMPVQRGPSPGPNNAYGGGYGGGYGNDGAYGYNNGYGNNDPYDYNSAYGAQNNPPGVPRHQF